MGRASRALHFFPIFSSTTRTFRIVTSVSISQQPHVQAGRLELTLVEGDYSGDTYFPPYRHLIGSRYEKSAVEDHGAFRFETYRHVPA